SELFAQAFHPESLILEHFDEPESLATPYWPQPPKLDEQTLLHFEATHEAAVLALGELLCGQPVPPGDTLGMRLGLLLKDNALLRLLEGFLHIPRSLDELATYLGQQSERRSIAQHALIHEITAYLLLGSLASTDQ